ncbi:MAG: chloride channel protein [Vicinamibacteria bacterium]
MWWPALGGLIVGLGGYIFPQALGVGYDVIGALLTGEGSLHLVTGVLLVKSTTWVVSLGSRRWSSPMPASASGPWSAWERS